MTRQSGHAEEPIVFVVDDDSAMREALKSLLQSVGLQVALFDSAQGLMQSALPDVPSCIILDIRLPRVSGLDFQAELAEASIHVPIIFITGYGDIPMSVKAMKAGAVDFLTKPFRDQELLDAVSTAIERDRRRREEQRENRNLQNRFGSLTPREREVMSFVTAGTHEQADCREVGR